MIQKKFFQPKEKLTQVVFCTDTISRFQNVSNICMASADTFFDIDSIYFGLKIKK